MPLRAGGGVPSQPKPLESPLFTTFWVFAVSSKPSGRIEDGFSKDNYGAVWAIDMQTCKLHSVLLRNNFAACCRFLSFGRFFFLNVILHATTLVLDHFFLSLSFVGGCVSTALRPLCILVTTRNGGFVGTLNLIKPFSRC